MIQFDVITVTKNASASIEVTLNSVSSQTYEHINHVIIDGFSSDGTVDIIGKFNHCKKLNLFQQQANGIANAFNSGLLKSSGDIVIFLNSGDRFVNIDVVAKLVESYIQNIWLWAFGETIAISRKGYLKRHVKQYDQWNQDLLLYHNPICHQSTVLSRVFIKEVGLYNENLSLEMDYEFNIRAALIAQPFLLYFPISYYDTTGVSSTKVFRLNRVRRDLRRKYFPLNPLNDFWVESSCLAHATMRFLMIPFKTLL